MPDSEAVKIWRDFTRYNLNASRKRDIDLTVTDLELWKFVLDHWGYFKKGKWVKFNPLAVGHQLSEYERLERKKDGQSALAYASSDASSDSKVWRD